MRYQYTSPGAGNPFQTAVKNTPQGIKLLIIINIIVFAAVELSGVRGELFRQFGLVPSFVWQNFKIWQPFTYLFLHGGATHLLLNMFVLWMFGRELEEIWGKKQFFVYYFITGIGAGLITTLFSLYSIVPIVGASGAIYGLLLAYGVMYPERKVYVYFLFPVKIKYFVAVLAGLSFFASLSPGQSVISHLTHLSGMIIGYIYLSKGFQIKSIKHWFLKYQLRKMKPKSPQQKSNLSKKNPKTDDSLYKRRVDQILDKMNTVGWDELSESEKNMLYSTSKKYSQDQSPN